MNLDSLIVHAAKRRASDLHLEPGLPAALRIQGDLVSSGEVLSQGLVRGLAREAIGDADWPDFQVRRSWDLVRVCAGVRCRINALHSTRGVGLAIRLLPDAVPTLRSLNLHPTLKALADHSHGLVLVAGPTGSGKSSTLAALLQEINRERPVHIVTIEQPVEFMLRPQRALIRQREVGRHTPSWEQALLDAMREDPDVIMVGELREPEAMRLTLNAAETGHLVMSTVHASTVAEAIQRIILAFPAQIQSGIAAQLADCLRMVVSQRLVYRADLDLRVPECEILPAVTPVRHAIRQQEFVKLQQIMETGASEGLWTRERYRTWLASRTDFEQPSPIGLAEAGAAPPAPQEKTTREPTLDRPRPTVRPQDGVMEISPPDLDARDILSELERMADDED